MSTTRKIPFIAFLAILNFALLSFRLLDHHAKTPNKLLQKIAPQLDKLNINVVQDWSSKIAVDNREIIVAPLANWPGRNESRFEEAYVKDLKSGLYAGYAAIRYHKRINEKDLPETWKKAVKSNRVFISFTRADEKVAEQLRAILQENGYQVFTYIKDGKIGQTYEIVGKMMSTAGEHIIIDSPDSRTSPGVIAEALTRSNYKLEFPVIEFKRKDLRLETVPFFNRKREFINGIVKYQIPIIFDYGHRKTILIDPKVSNAGYYLDNMEIKINGKEIRDTKDFDHWEAILREKKIDQTLMPQKVYSNTILITKEHLVIKKKYEEALQKKEKQQTRDYERRRFEETQKRYEEYWRFMSRRAVRL